MSTAKKPQADTLVDDASTPDVAAATQEQSPFADPLTADVSPRATAETSGTASTPSESPTHEAAIGAGPRTRWAAIVWGLLFAVISGGALFVVLSPQRRLAFAESVLGLEPTTLALYCALAIGALVLLASLVGLLRRAQRALAARRSA